MGSMRDGFGTTGWWFDTSDLSPDETARRIIHEAPNRASVETT